MTVCDKDAVFTSGDFVLLSKDSRGCPYVVQWWSYCPKLSEVDAAKAELRANVVGPEDYAIGFALCGVVNLFPAEEKP